MGVRYLLFVIPLFVFTSCFTGIEKTDKIRLSRADRQAERRATDEQRFVASVQGAPASDWKAGRRFVVADEGVYKVFGTDPGSIHAGDTLYFTRLAPRVDPTGQTCLDVEFTGENGGLYTFTSGATDASALLSDNLPMLIDLEMVSDMDTLLRGGQMWVNTRAWLDAGSRPLRGLKYEKIRVDRVVPGAGATPYAVRFTDTTGRHALLMMGASSLHGSPTSFSSLFTLTDPRLRYPKITDAVWHNIMAGKVAEGMTKEECRLALGAPTDVDSGADYSKTIDLWSYPDGRLLRFEDGRLVINR